MPLDRQKHGDTQPKTQPYAVGIRQNETKNTASENIKLNAKKKHATACFFRVWDLLVLFCVLSCFSVAMLFFLLSWFDFAAFFCAVWLFCGFVAVTIERGRCAVSVQRRAARRTGFVGGAVLCAAIFAFDHFHFHAFGERNVRLDF